MNHHKPVPLYPVAPAGKKCPICGKNSYSAGGIHPQCAVTQADAPRQKLLAEQRRAEKEQARIEE